MRSHLGKLRVWSSGGGPCPDDLLALGNDVWTADKPEHENGLKILGTPLGKPAYVEQFVNERMHKENCFLGKLLKMTDLQCAWIMLSFSAVPRANHMIRMVPPSSVHGYAESHDLAIWTTFCKLLGAEPLQYDLLARDISSMPARLGSLGLRSASRCSPGAFWVSWANALPVIKSKLPALANNIVQNLESTSVFGCIREASTASI